MVMTIYCVARPLVATVNANGVSPGIAAGATDLQCKTARAGTQYCGVSEIVNNCRKAALRRHDESAITHKFPKERAGACFFHCSFRYDADYQLGDTEFSPK
jgi:hypothetical protein